jgi:hypothetical protein
MAQRQAVVQVVQALHLVSLVLLLLTPEVVAEVVVPQVVSAEQVAAAMDLVALIFLVQVEPI